MIDIINLSHQYNTPQGGVPALKGISLKIVKGDFVAIIGHNGSGKSTLAKHLNVLLLPHEGQVFINGLDTKDKEKLWAIRQQVGMVFQNPDNQLIATTVEEDVAFGPENLGIEPSRIHALVNEALAIVGMEEYRQWSPHLLSGGQKQRVAIAGIVAMRPKVLVLDEPTAMLDPIGRREVMETVMRLNKEEGLTVVHITHFMEEAAYANRIIVMEAGRIVLDGPPREVFSQIEVLHQLSLDVPAMTELAAALTQGGINITGDVLTVEEMVTALCP